MEHGWLTDRRAIDQEFELYCHNPDCARYNERQVVPGVYETDIGWGEPDWIECECGSTMQGWKLRVDVADF